ncbi:MAG: tetraacyldisaccharide 4'-kinase [Holosporaceae bacterium]|jgi:tetraacyldisaccharide 4'-kinase|nr:tetraacyldisaccharide 4'-kinase [Holosporaceae bacterium]
MIFFKTPSFWYRKPNFLQKLLLKPISQLYQCISEKNYRKKYKYKSKFRVIAIGGMTVGGSGKTPVVESICNIIKSNKQTVAVLSRGFGRSSKETLEVNNLSHSYKDVGDEALMLSRSVPVYVGKDREKSAKLAELKKFDFLILDDGLMQRSLKPDIRLVVIDAQQGLGNGELFPLGPNRLNFSLINDDIEGVIILNGNIDFMLEKIPVFHGDFQYDFSQIKERILVFCGLGHPEKFFNALSSFSIAKKVVFPDHYPFSEEDIQKLISESKSLEATLVTTEKDLVRIPLKYQSLISTVPISIKWKENDALLKFFSREG